MERVSYDSDTLKSPKTQYETGIIDSSQVQKAYDSEGNLISLFVTLFDDEGENMLFMQRKAKLPIQLY